MTTIELNEPYYTAGKRFGWSGDMVGFGIKSQLLADEEELKVIVDNKEYTVSKKEAREEVLKYNAFYTIGKTKLAVVPKYLFHGLQNSTQSVVSEKQREITEENQGLLFTK